MSDGVVLRAARPEDVPRIHALLDLAYPEHLKVFVHAGLDLDGSHTFEQSRVAEVGDQIVSYVRVFDRPIRYGDAVLRMGGIGSVCTHTDFQGRGLASAVLADSVRYMRSQGYHLSMLFTGRQAFYARLGWSPFPQHSFRLALRPPLESVESIREMMPGGGRCDVREFDVGRDLAAVEAIYDEYNRRRTGPHVREHRYWTDRLAREAYDVLPSLVAERNGEVVAYASFRPRQGALLLYEGACRDGETEAFLPLGWVVLRRAAEMGAAVLEGQLPVSHGLLAALRRLDVGGYEGYVREALMVRVVDLRALFEASLPELGRRLALRPWLASSKVELCFRLRGESVRLRVLRGELVLDFVDHEGRLALDTGLFCRLFLGAAPLTYLLEELAGRGIYPTEGEIALLDALFPPQDPFYLRADRF